jgi:tetratricopeptide (TPR) repeat protein
MDALIAALSRPRRRGVLVWSAAAVTTTALVALARPAGEAPVQCSLRPLARLSVEQKQQLTETLSAYDLSAPEYVLSELDQFSASWEAERRTSCATSVALPRAAATRMCLARTQQAYDARLHLLLEESPEALARANDLVHNLPPPDTCRTPEARHAGLELSDLQRRVVTRLARASANFDAGRYSEALKHSDEALALASDLGQPSLLARSLTSHADTHAVLSLPAEAIELYEEAFLLAKEHGLDTIARRSALGAAPLHARIGQREQAERWLDAAASEVARAGSTPTMRARLHLARARALDYFEQFDAGRDEVDKGLALTEDPRLRLSLVGRLTSLNERSGLAPALRLPDCHRRIDLALQVFGASHPQVATAYMHLAKVLAYDDPKTAQDAYESAREIFERSSGPNNPSLVRLDAKLARAQSDAGDPDAAEESFRRAITLQEQLSPDDRTLVALNTNFGALLEGRGRTREARQRHERARVLADAVFGPSSIEAAVTRVNLAAGLLGTAGVARAVELLEQALPTFEPRLDRSHFNLTPVVANLVQAYVETGRFEDAAAALETLRAASNDGDENQGVIERLQAQLDAALGHVPRAIRSTRRCINRPFESPLAPTRLLCLELAAILIHTHGRPTELRALLRPELETLRDPSALPRPAARLLFLLATTERHRPTAQRLAGEALERLDGASGEIADTLRARIQAEFGAVP